MRPPQPKIEHFKSLAGQRGYQTLINEALKQAIQAEHRGRCSQGDPRGAAAHPTGLNALLYYGLYYTPVLSLERTTMRTISIRLDDHTDAVLTAHCQRNGLTQTDAIKTAIEQLAGKHKPTPAELAAELGLIGGFRSGEGDLAANHSQRVKDRLRAKRMCESVPVPAPGPADNPRRRRAAAT